MATRARIAAMETRFTFTMSQCTKSCLLIGPIDIYLPFLRAGDPAAVDARWPAPPGSAVLAPSVPGAGVSEPPTTRTIARTTTRTIIRLHRKMTLRVELRGAIMSAQRRAVRMKERPAWGHAAYGMEHGGGGTSGKWAVQRGSSESLK